MCIIHMYVGSIHLLKNAEARLQEASLDGSKNVTDKLSDIQTNTEYENRGPSNL